MLGVSLAAAKWYEKQAIQHFNAAICVSMKDCQGLQKKWKHLNCISDLESKIEALEKIISPLLPFDVRGMVKKLEKAEAFTPGMHFVIIEMKTFNEFLSDIRILLRSLRLVSCFNSFTCI